MPKLSSCLFLELMNIRRYEIIAGESWYIVLVPDTSDPSSPRSCPEETSSTDCSEVHERFRLCYLKSGGLMQVNTRLELHKNWLYTVNIVFPSLSCVGGKPVWTCARPFHMLLFVTSIAFQNFPISFIFFGNVHGVLILCGRVPYVATSDKAFKVSGRKQLQSQGTCKYELLNATQSTKARIYRVDYEWLEENSCRTSF